MTPERAEAVANDPRYLRLIRRRGRLSVILTAIILLVYFGFILLVAFDKAWLGRPLAGGATSIGIVIGFGVILTAIALTGFYVRRANREFDVEVARIAADARA